MSQREWLTERFVVCHAPLPDCYSIDWATDGGLRIPDDLSVFGFDNQHSVADSLFPGLTTMALPIEMGPGVRNLVDEVEQHGHRSAEHGSGPIVQRGSVAPPPSMRKGGAVGQGHREDGGNGRSRPSRLSTPDGASR